MKLDKKSLLIIGIVFVILGAVVVILRGRTYTLEIRAWGGFDDAGDYDVSIDQDCEIIAVENKRLEGDVLLLDLRSVSRGRAYVHVVSPDESGAMEIVYVHAFGVITVNNFFGRSTGSRIIPVLTELYIALLLAYLFVQYRTGIKRTLFRYRNVRNLGWIIFLSMMLLQQLPALLTNDSLVDTARVSLSAASAASFFGLPVAFIVSVLVTISNIQLMRREGYSWRNMLGVMVGLFVCFCSIAPHVLSEFLQRTTLVDVHNERGAAMYIEMAVTNTVLIAVSYLECILWGTVVLAVKAAKHIPTFDKDYILILGSQIRRDGTLTPLLKGRADRALAFASMQKEATGKDIVFVPSGGQGADEIMPEGQAIRNYLIEAGVPEDRILTEDRSVNTYENFRNSVELIRAGGIEDPKIAFSTTNYHVFRSGIIAEQQGIRAEGIGSGTRSYFWVNAFVREFIATVYAEWKRHLRIIAILILLTLAMVLFWYLSNVL